MSEADPTPPAGRLSGTAVAVEARLVELGIDGECVEATRGDLAASLGVSSDAVKRALSALERHGRVVVERNAGGHSCYARPTPTARPQPPDPPDLAARPARPGRAPDLSPLAGERAALSPPLTSRSPETAPVAGNASAPAGEPPDPARPPDPPDRPTEAPIANPATAVVIAAADEAKRLGKAALDEALKTKLGSQAKRMHAGGVAIVDLEAAARYAVAHDMTALDAAHRKAQSVAAQAVGEIPAMRASEAEKDELYRLAEESRLGRDATSLEPHREEELIEVWWFLAGTWPRAPLLGAGERALWHKQLALLPTSCILWALREIARSGERFAPTWGQVWTVGAPKLREALEKRRHDAQIQRQREADAS